MKVDVMKVEWGCHNLYNQAVCASLLHMLLFLQILTLNLSNPTNRPLTIQPVFLHHYTRPHTIVNLLADRMDPELHNFDFSRSTAFAFQVDSQTTDSAMNNVVIPAHSESYQITIAFTPKVDLQVASLLLIRNNLTILDYVLLEGCGHQGMFTIDNVPPESEPLLFEFSTTQLEKCQGRVGQPHMFISP